MRDFIIDKPESLKAHHKVTAVSMSVIFWFVTFYLWQPLISLIAWLMGFNLFHYHMITLEGFKGFYELLLYYVLIIFVLGFLFLLWAKVNQWRFRGKDKRKVSPPVSQADVANYFKVPAQSYQQWLSEKKITLLVQQDSNRDIRVESI
ncbi:MAG: poly-beta-1,6-N-acetyl-D-glucosamine biosynthesis protein PgaD [Kangiellaceae bacterium]|nr:poly-beta-1,6-N-acetyl-D-glucosamine biosynthesis protein PgaD [Kangiellaceae bacterium]